MEFKELINVRRSIRQYAGPAPRTDLEAILRDAQNAPSWKNQQTARCYVLESPEILEELRASALPAFNQKSSAGASLIVTTYVKNIVGFSDGMPVNEVGNGWGAYDLGLHDAYLILAAKERGYDTLIMGIRDSDVIRRKLAIPAEEEIVSVIAVGQRAAEAVPRPRKPLEEVVKFF